MGDLGYGWGRVEQPGSGLTIQQALPFGFVKDPPELLIPLYPFLQPPAQLADRTTLHPKVCPIEFTF